MGLLFYAYQSTASCNSSATVVEVAGAVILRLQISRDENKVSRPACATTLVHRHPNQVLSFIIKLHRFGIESASQVLSPIQPPIAERNLALTTKHFQAISKTSSSSQSHL